VISAVCRSGVGALGSRWAGVVRWGAGLGCSGVGGLLCGVVWVGGASEWSADSHLVAASRPERLRGLRVSPWRSIRPPVACALGSHFGVSSPSPFVCPLFFHDPAPQLFTRCCCSLARSAWPRRARPGAPPAKCVWGGVCRVVAPARRGAGSRVPSGVWGAGAVGRAGWVGLGVMLGGGWWCGCAGVGGWGVLRGRWWLGGGGRSAETKATQIRLKPGLFCVTRRLSAASLSVRCSAWVPSSASFGGRIRIGPRFSGFVVLRVRF